MGDCVIVGRAADYILKDTQKLIKIFLYAPMDYKIKNIKNNYKDSDKEAEKNVNKSTKLRATYYELISNQTWGMKENYDLCLNCKVGNEMIINTICDYVKNRKEL